MSGTADGYIYIDLKLQQDEFDKRLSNLENKTNSFASTVKKALAIIGLGEIAKKAVGYIKDVGSSFEATMSKVQAISGASGKELEALTAKAKEMGAKTKFSATESAEAFTYMAMAGWKTVDMLNGIDGIMNLAAASGEDLASVSDIVTDAMTAFGLSASGTTTIIKDGYTKEVSNASHFADVLAKASSASNTNVGMMGETFKYVAPVAGALKYSVEDCAVAIGLMANSGIKSSQAGTALRSMLSRMVKPTDDVKAAMDKLGISLTDSSGNMKPLSQLMTEMRQKFGKLSDSQKAQYASTIAGQEAMSGLLAIVNASDDDFNSLTQQINNADGAAQEMADTMQNNLAGKLTIMGSGIEGIAISIYEKVAPALEDFVDYITNNVLPVIQDFVNGDFSKIEDWIPIIELVGGVLATLTSGFIAFKTAIAITVLISKVTTALGLLKVAFVTLSNLGLGGTIKMLLGFASPITLVIAAIGALVGAVIYLWNTNEGFRKTVINIVNSIIKTVTGVVNSIVDFFTNTIPTAFNGFVTAISEFIGNVTDTIVNFFTVTIPSYFNSFLNFVSKLVSTVSDYFVQLWNGIVNFFMQTVPSWINKVIEFFNKIPYYLGYMVGLAIGYFVKWGIDLYNFATTTIPEVVDEVVTWFASLPGRIWDWLVNAYDNVTTWGSNLWDKAVEVGSNFIDKIISYISQLPGRIWNWLVSAYNNVTSWASNIWNKARDAGSKFIDNVVSYISQLPGKIWTWLTTAAQRVVNWGSSLWSNGKRAAGQLVSGVVDTIKSIPGKIVSIGSDIVKGMWKGINGAKDWLFGKIGGFASGVVKGFKSALGIHSPSKVMADQIGKFMPPGIAKGFEQSMPEANKDMSSNIDTMVDNFKSEVNDSAIRNQGNGKYDPNPIPRDDGAGFDYTRLGNVMVNAFASAGVTIKVNEREAGRIIKEVSYV